MEGNLVIVESPAKAKTIQKFLGKDYIVKPSFGHIRDLQEKKLSINIEGNFAPEYVIPADKKAVVADLKKIAKDVDTVWLASDEDREGEAISWHLAQTLDLDPLKTRRIVFHEITKPAILEAIQNPRSVDMNLVNAQQARRVLDRLVGFELSPILWRKIQPKLSAGRVQSVALRLVVEREKEIMAFQHNSFYRVEATFHPEGADAGVKVKALLDKKFEGIDEARSFLEDCIGATFRVESLEEKKGTRTPAAPFTTSTLQQEAARVLHFPVSLTMRLAQGLYEKGLITYMRTDSTNLSGLAINTAKKYICDNFGENFSHPRQYKTRAKGAQEAHEAIRPTFIENTAITGTVQEQKLYSLIWKRTVASQMAEASVMNTTVKVGSDKRSEKFGIQASKILFEGFLKVYMESQEEDATPAEELNTLPPMKIGDVLEAKGINAECKFTPAPLRYSEAMLVKKLEELGIGRPSTYAPTITTLTTGRGYITKGDKEGTRQTVTNLSLKGKVISSSEKTEVVGAEKGKLLPQDIGIIVSDFLVKNFPDIVNYDFTADVEKDFDRIAEGELNWTDVIGGFYSPFHKKVDETMSDRQFTHVSREIGLAPDGETLVAKFGQYGAYIQKGPAEKRQFASLGKGQLIETITVEEAMKLFALPRTLGQYQGEDVIALKGKFGPFLKCGERNVSLPKGMDPLKITLEEAAALIDEAAGKLAPNAVIADYPDSDIQILNGRFGPYIKHAGQNYRIPKTADAAALTEEACKDIISNSEPTAHKGRRRVKK